MLCCWNFVLSCCVSFFPRLAIPPKCSPDPNRLSLASSINTSRCFFFKHSINYTTPYFLYSFFETTAPPSSVYCGYVNSGRQGWMSWDSLAHVSPCHTLLSHSRSSISLSFSHSHSPILLNLRWMQKFPLADSDYSDGRCCVISCPQEARLRRRRRRKFWFLI